MADIGIVQRGLDVFILYTDKRFEKGPLTYFEFPKIPTPESINAALNYIDELLSRFAPTVRITITATGQSLPTTGSGMTYVGGETVTTNVVLKGTGAAVLNVDPIKLCEAISTRNLGIWSSVFLQQLKTSGVSIPQIIDPAEFPEFRMFQ